ncbi:hypothetical protein Pmani_037547 [Petrolisthes manimaculis]|uniref:Hexosyltransferase n=1 Tax=Petrolisthes manimaculis TaxID=1843537 RepID=A0AAE1NHJ2_9EUCA|nr:hypothetical protein Pmani_037547 [Petrolisthes manimaculis]
MIGSRSSPRRLVTVALLTVAVGGVLSLLMVAVSGPYYQHHHQQQHGHHPRLPRHAHQQQQNPSTSSPQHRQPNEQENGILSNEESTSDKENSIRDRIPGWPYSLRINEPAMCEGQDVYLLNAVTSNPTGVYHRNMIRKMWGSDAIARRLKMRTVFIMGAVLSPVTQKHLQDESDKYHDIVQFDFLETRKNLTIKSLAAIHWYRSFCTNATWMLKCDVDAYINFFALLDILRPVNDTQDAVCARSMTRSVCREATQHGCLSHYVVDPKEYAPHTYPPYCQGYAYVLHGRLADRLLEEDSKRVGPPLWLEDVYVTGLLPRDLNARWLDVRRKSQVVPVSIRTEFHNGSMLFIHDLEGQIGQGATSYVWTQTLNHYNIT